MRQTYLVGEKTPYTDIYTVTKTAYIAFTRLIYEAINT